VTRIIDGPNQLWVADITYIAIATVFVYLAAILDAWSRRVIGYAISRSINARLAVGGPERGATSRQPPEGCIHHSDRGSQYASETYRNLLADHGLVGSMGRRGSGRRTSGQAPETALLTQRRHRGGVIAVSHNSAWRIGELEAARLGFDRAEWLTLGEATRLCRRSKDCVRLWSRRYRIAKRICGAYLIDGGRFRDFLNGQRDFDPWPE
jgi:hypothetical protein